METTVDDVRIVTIVNEGFVRAGFASNWIASLRRVGLEGNATIYASDEGACKLLKRRRIPFERWVDPLIRSGSEWADYSTLHFKRVMLSKLSLIRHLTLEDERPLLFSDADIVFLGDPLETIFDHAGDCPLCFQPDHRCFVGDPDPLLCAGFVFVQPQHWKKWGHLLDPTRDDTEHFMGDQKLLQDRIIHRGEAPYRLLPHGLFPNGSCLMNGGSIPKDALIMHFNYMIGRRKLIEMRKHGCWYVRDGWQAYLRVLLASDKDRVGQWRICLGRLRRRFWS